MITMPTLKNPDIIEVVETARLNDSTWIVLARIPGYHPFATWLVNLDGHTVHGDYCETIDDARDSMRERCKRTRYDGYAWERNR